MLAARAWRLPARMWSAVSGSIRKRTFASLAAFQSTTPLTSAVASAHHDAHGHGHDAHGHAHDAHGHAHDDHGHGHDDHGHGHGHHDPNKTSVDPPTDMGWTDIWYRAPYFPFNNNPEGAYEKTIPNNPYPGHSQPHEWSRPYPYPTAFHIPVPFGTGEEHVLDKDDPRWLDRYGRLPAGHQPKPQIVSTEPGWHFRQDQQLAHSTTYTPTSSDPYSSRVRYEHETFEWTISENWRGKFEPFPEIWWDDGRGRKEFLGDWDPYVTGTKAFFSFLAVFLGTMTPYFLAGYTLCIWMGPKQRYENSVPFRGLYLDYGGDPQFIDNMPASLPDGNCCYPG